MSTIVSVPTWIEVAGKVKEENSYTFVHVETGEELPDYEHKPKLEPFDAEEGDDTPEAVLLDVMTASVLCVVWDALSDAHKQAFARMPFFVAVQAAWKAYGAAKIAA